MRALAKRLTNRLERDKLRRQIGPAFDAGFPARRPRSMTITVKVGEAKTHLSDLLVRVEAGEEIIIARGNEPIARLTRIEKANDLAAVIAEARAARAQAKPVTR